MIYRKYKFSSASTDFYYLGNISVLKKIADQKNSVIITDENVFNAHQKKFSGWNSIVLKPGEQFKVQATADSIINELILMEADRKTTIIGIGGGVVTDITGYVASIYMRGVRFGFVPTTILGLVDASIGGKNGVDVGLHKNFAGLIRQPSFILHDMALLASLPQIEWINGFAEIIKHACIADVTMFNALEKEKIGSYENNVKLLGDLVMRNALLKIKVVQKDEFEHGGRRLLNFGHTIGHALETQYDLLHGQAISIGMTCACHLSAQLNGFNDSDRIVGLLEKYNLPTYASFNSKKVFDVLRMDKKRVRKEMNFVLLDKIGKASIKSIPLKKLEKLIQGLS